MASKGKKPSAAGKNVITEPSITLISSDGREFSISESAAALSETIQKILNKKSGTEKSVSLPEVGGDTLATVAAYLDAHAAAAANVTEKNKMDSDFLADKSEIDVLIDVVLAAEYLGIAGLMDLVSEKIADMIRDKSVEWVRKAFGIENDLTDKDVEEMKNQSLWTWEGVEPDNDD